MSGQYFYDLEMQEDAAWAGSPPDRSRLSQKLALITPRDPERDQRTLNTLLNVTLPEWRLKQLGEKA